MKGNKNKGKNARGIPIIEALSNRVLFSADPLGLSDSLLAGGSDAPESMPESTPATLLDIAFDTTVAATSEPVRSTELVIIDTTVPDFHRVIDSLSHDSPQTDFIIRTLHSTQSIEHVDSLLSDYTNLTGIHFITHGTDATLRLGTTSIDNDNIAQHQNSFSNWGDALSEHGDILFYGCNFAETDDGKALVNAIAQATNADVSASVDWTGHDSLNANWQLEYSTGLIESNTQHIADSLQHWESVLAAITVDTFNDLVDAPDLSSISALLNSAQGPGPDGFISLREAVIAANAEPDADVIYLSSGTYTLNAPIDPALPDAYHGDLNINNPVTIIGTGTDAASGTTIDGENRDRIMSIFQADTVSLQSLTLQNGQASDSGGALYVLETDVTVESVNILDNKAPAGAGVFLDNSDAYLNDLTVAFNDASQQGGGIYINNSTVHGYQLDINNNRASNIALTGQGGGIFVNGLLYLDASNVEDNFSGLGGGLYVNGELRMSDNTVSYNTARFDGGGIYSNGASYADRSLIAYNTADGGAGVLNRGFTQLQDTTLAWNASTSFGAAVKSIAGDTQLYRSTIADNTSPSPGAALYLDPGANIGIQGTLIARNGASNTIHQDVMSNGFNLTDSVIVNPHASDQQLTSTGLDTALTDNGGSVQTYALQQNSQAIDAGALIDTNADQQIVDATGAARDSTADIGAYEFRQSTPQAPFWYGPSISTNQGLVLSEDSTVAINFNNLMATDPDTTPDNIHFTVTSLPANGELRVDGAPVTATNSTFTQADISAGKVIYQNLGTPGPDNFSFFVTDDNHTGQVKVFNIDVTAVNDAPVLDNSATFYLDSTLVNITNTPGNSVNVILQSVGVDAITDTDSTALEGIAIIAADETNGSWQFKANPGDASWSPITSASTGVVWDQNALLLKPSSLVRFVPNTDFIGQATIDFRAHDWTPAPGQPAGTHFNIQNSGFGGASSNSAAVGTAAINVEDTRPTLSTIEIANAQHLENSPTGITGSLSIIDADSPVLQSATATITAGLSSNEDQLTFSNTSSIAGNYNPVTGVLTMTGAASIAEYQNALRLVQYNNTSDVPQTHARTISFTVNDGTEDSNPLSRSIDILAVNDRPAIVNLNASQTYFPDNGPVYLDTSVSVQDPELDSLNGGAGNYSGASLTVGRSDPDDRFYLDSAPLDSSTNVVMHNGAVIAGYSISNGNLEITFTDADGLAPTSQTVNNLIRLIGYSNPNSTDSSSIYLSVALNDGNTGAQGLGGEQVDTDPITLNVLISSPPPTISAPISFETDEDVPFAFTLSDQFFIDHGNSEDYPQRAVLRASNGVLSVQHPGNAVVTGNSDKSLLTIEGTRSEINNALASLVYTPNPDYNSNGETTDLINIWLSRNINQQGLYWFSDNQATDYNATTSNHGTFIDNATVTTGPSGEKYLTLNGDGDAVSIPTDFGISDVFSIRARINISQPNPLGAGEMTIISIGDSIALTLNTENNQLSGSYKSSAGDYRETTATDVNLVTGRWHDLHYTVDTVAGTQALYVDGTLIQETNYTADLLLDDPAATTTLGASPGSTPNYFYGNMDSIGVYIDTFSKDTIEGITARAFSTANHVHFIVHPVNDKPVLDLDISNAAHNHFTSEFIEGNGPVAITGTTAISDIDNTTITEMVVSITNAQDAGNETIQATIPDGWVQTYSNDKLTIVPDTSTTAMVPATHSNWSTVVESLTYLNTSLDPDSTPREITLQISDGSDTNNPLAISTISIQTDNKAPVLATIETMPAFFIENGPAVGITGNLQLTDVDDIDIESATISISNNYNPSEDVLSLSAQANISSNFDAASGTLTLTGPALKSEFEAALHSVNYYNTSENRSDLVRTVEFRVNDGDVDSNVLTRDIEIIPVNDPPVVSANTGASSVVGGTAAIDSTMLSEADPDDTGVGLTYNITSSANGKVELSSAPGVSISAFTQADIEAGLVRFIHDGLSIQNGSFDFSLADGGEDGAQPAAGTFVITVTGALDDAYSTDEDSTLSIPAPGVLSNDSASSSRTVGMLDDSSLSGSVALSPDGSFVYQPNGAFESLNAGDSGTDSFDYTYDDGSGSQQTATVTISVTGINDAPTLGTIELQPVFYIENGNAVGLTGNLSLADIDDSELLTASIRISNNYIAGEDVLSLPAQPNISSSFDATTGILTLSGPALKSEFETALHSVNYFNTSENPSSQVRTVEFVINDGDVDSIVLSRDIVNIPVNDSPLVSINTGPSSVVGGTVNINSTVLSEADPDDDSVGMTYHITAVANGQVELSSNPGVAISSFTQADLDANVVRFVHDGLSAQNGSFDFGLADGGENGTQPATGTFVVTVTGALDDVYSTDEDSTLSIAAPGLLGNDSTGSAPFVASVDDSGTTGTIAVNPDGSFDYQPNGAFESLNAKQTSSDSFDYTYDDGQGNQQTATATMTIAGVNDAPALSGIEVLPASFTEGLAAVAITDVVSLNDVDDTNIQSATIAITTNFSAAEDELDFTDQFGISGSYNSADGIMTLSGNASVVAYENAIRSVTYNNTSNNPSTLDRTVSITVNDHSATSNTLTRNIHITPVNNTPVLSNIESIPATFIENGTQAGITGNLKIADTDNFNLDSATVAITGNHVPTEDVLSVQLDSTSGINATFNPANGELTLTGNSSLANYEAAIHAVKYQNLSDNPTVADRTITITVNDGDTNSAPISRNIEIASINDVPSIQGMEQTPLQFTEGDSALLTTTSIEIEDVDNPTLQNAVVAISNNYVAGEDELIVDNSTLSTLYGLTSSFNISTGELNLLGTATITDYQQAMRSVSYVNHSESPSTATRTLSYTVNDGTHDSNIATRTLEVIAVNDAPQTGNISITTSEDTAYIIPFSDFLFTDTDNNNLLEIIVDTTNPRVSADNIAQTVTYTPATNFTGADSFTFAVKDNGGTANLGTDTSAPAVVDINVTPVNDAPATVDVNLPTISEDSMPFGQVITSLVGTAFSDIDTADALTGIAVTGNTESPENGVWQYAILGGVWQNIDDSQALLNGANALFLDKDTTIRFLPAVNYNGTPYPLTYKAIDSSYTGAFSTETQRIALDTNVISADSHLSDSAAISIQVNPVNDAPVIADSNLDSLPEDTITTTPMQIADLFAAQYSDSDGTAALSGIAVTENPAIANEGNWQYSINGADWYNVNTVSNSNALLLERDTFIRFAPATNFHGEPADLLLRAVDGSFTGGFTADNASRETLDTTTAGNMVSAEQAVSINILPVNDAPQGTDTAVSILEDTAYTFSTADFGFSDPVESDAFNGITVRALPLNGTLLLNGLPLNVDDQVSTIDLDNGNFTYAPAANVNGQDSWEFVVSDNGGTANNGIDQDQSTNTITFNIAPVNDAPSGANRILATDESTPIQFSTDDFGFTDAIDQHSFESVSIETIPGSGSLLLGGTPVAQGDQIDVNEIISGLMTFVPAPLSVTSLAEFDFKVADNGGTSNNGEDTASTVNKITINIATDNNPPIGRDNTIELNEDSTSVLDAAMFGFSDTIDGHSLAGVFISTSSINGALLLDSLPVSDNTFVSVSDLNADLLTFTPTPNEFGVNYASIQFKVLDNGKSVSGKQISTEDNTLTINVNPINDAPTLSIDDNLELTENSAADSIDNTTVSDADINDTHVFSVSDERFEVVNGALALKPGITLDFETESQISLQVTVTDSAGSVATNDIVLQVLNVNEAPVQPAPANDQTDVAPFSFSLPETLFIDADGDSLVSTATLEDGSPLPAWVIFEDGTFTIAEDAPVGPVNVLVTATDPGGLTATSTLTIEIQPEPEPAIAEANSIAEFPTTAPTKVATAPTEEPEVIIEDADSSPDHDLLPPPEEQFDAAKINISEDTQTQRQLPDVIQLNALTTASTSVLTTNDNIGIVLANDFDVLLTANNIEAQQTKQQAALTALTMNNLATEADKNRGAMANSQVITPTVLATSVTLTSSFSVGYILWLLRGGTLLASVMASMPAWRAIDPLPVLESLTSDDDNDTETLESMVEESELENSSDPQDAPDKAA